MDCSTAFTTIAQAQTGKDLFTVCTSQNAIRRSCELYISGFVHGMQIGRDVQDDVCLPATLTGNQATEIFIRTLREIKIAAVHGKAVSTDVNPFFTEKQSAIVSGVAWNAVQM